MKIYNALVMDIETGETIFEDFFEYEGCVALCGSGGGGGTTMIREGDVEYNRRMADIAEEQQAMAKEYFEYYKSGTGHWEQGARNIASSEVNYGGKRYAQYGEDMQYYDSEGMPSGVFLDVNNSQLVDAGGNVLGTFTGDPYAAHETGYGELGGTEVAVTGGGTAQLTRYAGSEGKRVWVADPDAVSFQQWEQEQLKSNLQLLPGQTALTEEQTEYLREQVATGRALLPWEEELAKKQMHADWGAAESYLQTLPGQTELTKEQIASQRELLPWGTELQKQQMLGQWGVAKAKELAWPEYTKQLTKGADVAGEMGKARADVEQAYSATQGEWRREAGRMGVDPTAPRYSSQAGRILREKTGALAGAGTKARRYAEEKQFERLKGAVYA